jgi:CheY-like chemotaxis protein
MELKQQLDGVLLVDDDESANFLNRLVINRAQVTGKILSSLNGEEALQVLRHASSDGAANTTSAPTLLILLDINMPVMDGWEFLSEYNATSHQEHQNIIYVLSTSSNPADERRALETRNVSGYIQKPLTTAKLEGLIQRHFPQFLK